MQYLARFFFVSLFVYVILSLGYSKVGEGYRAYVGATDDKFKHLFVDSTFYDVLLLGSSRTHRNIAPVVCDSITGISFYNAGVSGAVGFEMETVLRGYLSEHPAPKFVLLNFDLGILSNDRRLYNPIIYYNYMDNDEIYSSISAIENLAWLYKYVPFFRLLSFNDDTRYEAMGGLLGQTHRYNTDFKGFSPIPYRFTKFDVRTIRPTYLSCDIFNLPALNSIVDVCRKKGVKLIFFNSPVYNSYYSRRYSNYDSILDAADLYCTFNEISFLRFDSLFNEYPDSFFFDDIHLNEEGSYKFSVDFADTFGQTVLLEQSMTSVKD